MILLFLSESIRIILLSALNAFAVQFLNKPPRRQGRKEDLRDRVLGLQKSWLRQPTIPQMFVSYKYYTAILPKSKKSILSVLSAFAVQSFNKPPRRQGHEEDLRDRVPGLQKNLLRQPTIP
jgi:hypothetical protein